MNFLTRTVTAASDILYGEVNSSKKSRQIRNVQESQSLDYQDKKITPIFAMKLPHEQSQ